MPINFKEFRLEILRVLGGVYSELIKEKSVFGNSILLLTTLSILSWPFLFYYLLKLDLLTWSSLGITFFMLVLNTTIFQLKTGKKTLHFLPYFIPLYLFFSLASIETVFNTLTKKKIIWHTLKKEI